MTKEEAQHIVDVAFDVPLAVRRSGEDRTYHEGEIREAKNMAIEALEQESVLDKIRAEIEELKPNNPNFKGYFEQNVALNKALKVIDKYRAESEEEE